VLGGRYEGHPASDGAPRVGLGLCATDGAVVLSAWMAGWRPEDDDVDLVRADLRLPGGGILMDPTGPI
jgi:hypothetical protein